MFLLQEFTRKSDDVSSNKSQIQEVKRILKLEFDMMDLGNARRILDMEIVRNREDHTLFLSQKGYLEKVLKRFSME